jgi:predicted Zn-ribbon and HTH transcriptional regulator
MSDVIAEVIDFLAECNRRGVAVHIGPRWCSRCGVEPRDLPTQRYCAACRREYRRERHKSTMSSVSRETVSLAA